MVTDTSTTPAACAGVVAVAEVPAGFTDSRVARTPPNRTSMPDRRSVPVNVTDSPPVVEPSFGDTSVRLGVAT